MSLGVRCRIIGAGLRAVFGVLLLCGGGTVVAATTAGASVPLAQKHILVLYSYAVGYRSFDAFNRGWQRTIEQVGIGYNQVYAEGLDLSRFETSEDRRNLRDYLRHKYAGRSVDLIVTVNPLASAFLASEGSSFLGKVPVLAIAAPESDAKALAGRKVVLVSDERDFVGTLRQALQLFPATRRVMVILGESEAERRYEAAARSAFVPWSKRIAFEYAAGRSLEEIRQRLSILPPDSVVIFGSMFRDVTGQRFSRVDVARRVAADAPVPVFGFYDFMMGTGIVGGSMVSYEYEGARAGQLAYELLTGKRRLDETATILPVHLTPMADWRLLKRWQVPERRVPEGTVMLHRPPSLWREYKAYVIGVMVFLAAQLALILALLAQRRERRQAEQRLAEHQERLRRVQAEFDHVSRLSTLGEMATHIAHELNQPLTAISNYCDAALRLMLSGRGQPGELMPALQAAAVQATRGGEIIRRIREFVGSKRTRMSWENVDEMVRDVVFLSKFEVQRHAIRLETHVEEDLPAVRVDKLLIEQVLMNLVQNAIDAMVGREGERLVNITATLEDGQMVVAVSDTGIGVPEEARTQIFDMFFTTKSEGTGAGLAICRSIVERHGGRIWVEPNVPRGTVFRFSLPLER